MHVRLKFLHSLLLLTDERIKEKVTEVTEQRERERELAFDTFEYNKLKI